MWEKLVKALLIEIPKDTVIAKYMSRSYTAEEMLEALETDPDTARAYFSDLMRLARDMLKRQATRQSHK